MNPAYYSNAYRLSRNGPFLAQVPTWVSICIVDVRRPAPVRLFACASGEKMRVALRSIR